MNLSKKILLAFVILVLVFAVFLPRNTARAQEISKEQATAMLFELEYAKKLLQRLQDFLFSQTQQVQAQTPDITSGLVGHWKFDETSGTEASDSSVNNNTGSLKNGLIWTAGQIDGALDFGGFNDYVLLPNIVNPGSSNVTAAAWVNADTFSNLNDDGDQAVILQHEGILGRTWLYIERIDSSTFQLQSFLGNASTATTINWNTFVGQWKFVAITYDGTTIRLFVAAERARL